MTKPTSPDPPPEPDADNDGALPLAPPPVQSDPLAKWRAARELEEDMADIFDEDRVTHKHGNAEPEAD